MVFDILAWGVTFVVGYFMGVGAERSKLLYKMIDWDSIRKRLQREETTEEKPV